MNELAGPFVARIFVQLSSETRTENSNKFITVPTHLVDRVPIFDSLNVHMRDP